MKQLICFEGQIFPSVLESKRGNLEISWRSHVKNLRLEYLLIRLIDGLLKHIFKGSIYFI